MPKYNSSEIEKKWQQKWVETGLYKTDLGKTKKKYYNLTMFPYPSGDKLHMGHWYNYAPHDSWGRYMRMKGFNVFQPMGFDAFGLPAENYAIKTGVHPTISIKENVNTMIKQLSRIGTMYDWEKMVNTSTPEYYKWTQWIFLQMYKNGLAYKKKAAVNWCPSCNTVLANEQVKEGKCDRCDSEVEKKELSQWFWKLSDYAQRLLDDMQYLEWPEKTLTMQKNWIGRSEGVEIDFKFTDSDEVLTCYTTRPDTIYSVTFVVMAPEHPLIDKLVQGTKYEKEVQKVVDQIKKQTDIERSSEGGKDKLGAFLGKYVINPANGEEIPVYVANFALMYGTGIVMADAHDQRDFEFARKYNIPLKFVISKDGKEIDPKDFDEAFLDDGILFNSGKFSGMGNREALSKIAAWMEKEGFGSKTVNYRLRDWLVSRQRYWGSPIPIVYCEKCGEVPVPEEELPIMLPEDVDFKPTGEPPLATSEKFVKTKCPKCGGAAKRDVETMDTFVCSSFYQLRYLDNKNEKELADKKVLKNWLPVDMYIGGAEHACMHLIYSRFVYKALQDFGYIPKECGPEPFRKLIHQGLITKDGAKMSKSKGNVVSPDSFVEQYGSDVFRMYLMFMGPYTDGGDWSDAGISGIVRFVDRVYNLFEKTDGQDSPEVLTKLHQTIKKVTSDIEQLHFNTAIAALMELLNLLEKQKNISKDTLQNLALLLAPMAPHLAEELHEKRGGEGSVFAQTWPSYDEKLTVSDTATFAVQVNGKLRGTFDADKNLAKEEALKLAREVQNVAVHLEGKEVVKEIFVKGKLVGFVVK
ncbi:MAG: leucine--tRNA ligase [Candidatus Gracilibacteria bacterium]|nr:leucine--tRNA ligase [Candidatus Gracilibacteria bacterium]